MAFDPARILRASRLRVGDLRAMGVPAILLGISGVILAAGATRTLFAVAPMLPETIREVKGLLEAARRDGRTPLQP